MTRNLQEEIEALQQRIRELASITDDDLAERYRIKGAPRPPGLYWRLRGIAAYIVRRLIALTPWRKVPWPVSLKQQSTHPKARPVIIWAIGTDRGTLRDGCTELGKRLASLRGFAPVLITDVADFAFFSRLGWLVEFLPPLAGHGEPYEERKLKYLARLYRGAPVIPVSAGLLPESELNLQRCLATGG